MSNSEHPQDGVLRAFELTLEGLITILEAQDTPAEALQLATERCSEAFDAVRAYETGLVGEEAQTLRRERGRILRLHALARSAAAAAAEHMATRVERAQGARRTLANLRAEADTGDGCDLQG